MGDCKELSKAEGSRGFDRAGCKLAAFDLDETLLHRSRMAKETVFALQRLKQSGITLAIATGRGLPCVPKELFELSCFDYALSANGACVSELSTGRVLHRFPIAPELAVRAVECIRRHGGLGGAFLESCMLIPRSSMRRMFRDTDPDIRHFLSAQFEAAARLTFRFAHSLKKSGEPIFKLNAFFETEEDCRCALEELKGMGGLLPLTTRGDDLEITAAGVSKAVGLNVLCKHLNIEPAQCIAFGDSHNDLELLQAAGCAVAMGNAAIEVKQAADFIAPTAEQNGCARAIERLFFDKGLDSSCHI
ncbi:MAG: HAD family hydrolase [Clostridia bacterium]|nr:HAD family hydrolase [Clostridia bacterium]